MNSVSCEPASFLLLTWSIFKPISFFQANLTAEYPPMLRGMRNSEEEFNALKDTLDYLVFHIKACVWRPTRIERRTMILSWHRLIILKTCLFIKSLELMSPHLTRRRQNRRSNQLNHYMELKWILAVCRGILEKQSTGCNYEKGWFYLI